MNGVLQTELIEEVNLENKIPICFANYCNLCGTCKNVDNSLTCICNTGFHGFNCQHRDKDFNLLVDQTSITPK